MKAYKYLYDLINNDTIVAAISGGPDSMYLLHVLNILKTKKDFNLIVAHVNHNLRLESEFEKQKVENYCKENAIIFEYLKIEKYPKDNFHNYARKVRYDFFEQLISRYNAKYLITAHHGDDLVETIMMRLVRGSTLKGYAGFSKISKQKNYFIVRPLIDITKEEIKTYMDKNSLWYAIDNSNEKDVYTRNRYRKYILPKLKKENKNVHLKFQEFSNKINDIGNFLEKYTDKVFDSVYCCEKLNIDNFKKEEKAVRDNILYRILQVKYGDKISSISSNNVDEIYKIIYSQKSNVKVSLPHNFEFVKSYDYCYFNLKKQILDYKIRITDEVKLSNGCVITKLEESNLTDNNVIYLNSNELSLPLYVRNKKPGDKMIVKNMSSYKKIKDIFINAKIDKEKRLDYPILVDSDDKIIWLPGIKKSNFDRKNSGKYDIILKYH